ncbi:MAG TPA: ATP-binding protein [Vicinamibacterales bacterium]|nr:ATP-binding protein [Vicinamibacterales bacterium]
MQVIPLNVMSVVVVLAMLLVTAFLFSLELRRRRVAEARLQEALASVEQQVADRTAALQKAMAELKLSEQHFRLIADLSPVHLFRMGRDGDTTFVSPSFLSVTAVQREQAMGFGWFDLVHPEDRERVTQGWHEAVAAQVIFQADFRLRVASGDYRWYRTRVVPDRDERGQIIGWVGATVDLHELHLALADRAEAVERAEHARRLAEEASHLKDEFLATASHELRTPLNAIVGWVHVLQSGALTDDEQRRQAVNAIDRNAKIQTRLIEDLLDVSRMIQGRVSLTVSPLDLRTVIDAAVETIRHAAQAKDIAIAAEKPDEPIGVIGDEHRLQQVIWNLLANSVKYTPRGGRVVVSLARERGRAMIRVTDSGDGIEPAFLPHVFEPFRQGASATMRSGLGLGLAIVRRLVDLHGGRITAESEGAGKGSTFTVSLPAAHGAAAVSALSMAPEPNFHRLHVLVAEDDADSAAAVTAILRLHGCETRTAPTAAECLRITGEWPTDVLICDVGLPDDDGYGLLRRLRSLPEGEHIPAIALTAYSRPEDRAKALAAGFRAHLSKPLNPENLLKELSSAAKDAPRSAA